MKFESSLKIQTVPEIVPGGSTPTPRGTTSIRPCPLHRARAGVSCLGHGRQRIHRVRDGTSNGDARSCVPAVVEAAYLEHWRNFVRPAPIKVECAERFLSSSTADMVKFCKDGSTRRRCHPPGEVSTRAETWSRCARTSRSSRSTTGSSAARPCRRAFRPARRTHGRLPLYGIANVKELFGAYPGRITCVILEPRSRAPAAGSLRGPRTRPR